MTGETTLIGRPSLVEILQAQRNVLTALILRDIKTRFGSAPGFLIAIAWPLSHILILVAINVWTGRIAPYGESAILWFAVSTTPFMIVSYTSRFMMFGLVMNRPLGLSHHQRLRHPPVPHSHRNHRLRLRGGLSGVDPDEP